MRGVVILPYDLDITIWENFEKKIVKMTNKNKKVIVSD